FGFAAMLAMLTAGAVATGPARADETRIALGAPFALADADGNIVSSADFPDKWLLVYFGYTHCADQSPTALSTMATALDELGPAAAYVQPWFVTVDPERDRGPVLREFAASFHPRLIGLGGTPEQINAAAGALGVEYRKVLTGDGDYVVDHSATLSIVAPD